MNTQRRKLTIHRDTLRRLDPSALRGIRGAAGTLTFEGGCNSEGPCPGGTGGTGGSTLECTQLLGPG